MEIEILKNESCIPIYTSRLFAILSPKDEVRWVNRIKLNRIIFWYMLEEKEGSVILNTTEEFQSILPRLRGNDSELKYLKLDLDLNMNQARDIIAAVKNNSNLKAVIIFSDCLISNPISAIMENMVSLNKDLEIHSFLRNSAIQVQPSTSLTNPTLHQFRESKAESKNSR